MVTILIALIAGVVGPGILLYFTGKQRTREKNQDYARQDAVAKAKKEQDEKDAKERAEAAELLLNRQEEIAKQADGVAKLLLDAQTKTTKETQEVARLAATGGGNSGTIGLVEVTLSYPNGNRQTVLLTEVPRAGENIRVNNGPNSPSLIVEHVLWVDRSEDSLPPYIILSVRPRISTDVKGSSEEGE